MSTICCAGIYRSGSTWLFNAVRIMIPSCNVIKRHPPSNEDYSIVVTSHRDMRTIAASILRKWGYQPGYGWDNVLSALIECSKHYDFWSMHKKCVYDMRYETMMSDPFSVFSEIHDIIGSEVNLEDAWKELNSLRCPAEGIDDTTLMHWNHVTSSNPYDTTPLNAIEILEIQRRFGEWQDKNGYV